MNKYKNKSNISGKVIQSSRIQHNLSLEKLSNKSLALTQFVFCGVNITPTIKIKDNIPKKIFFII